MKTYQSKGMTFQKIPGLSLNELLALGKACASGDSGPCVHCSMRGVDDCSSEVIGLLQTALSELVTRCSVLRHCLATGESVCTYCAHSHTRELHPCEVDGSIVPDCKAGARECGECKCRGCRGYSLFEPARD